jgi:ferritin-like metal-binding protein YciE
MFEKFNTPAELFSYKLGSALKMENTVLEMLGRLEQKANAEPLKQQFSHHAEETRQQIRNIEQAFGALGEEPDRHTNLVIEAIDKEGMLNAKRADDGLVDVVLLAGAAETEHYEIAVYEWLIAQAEGLDHPEIATLLRANLEQEQHTLDEVRQATQRMAHAVA